MDQHSSQQETHSLIRLQPKEFIISENKLQQLFYLLLWRLDQVFSDQPDKAFIRERKKRKENKTAGAEITITLHNTGDQIRNSGQRPSQKHIQEDEGESSCE